MGKTILGIGYILAAIPYVNIIGILLVAIGWFTLGKERDRGLWKVTGILGIVSFILMIAAIAIATSIFFAAMGSPAAIERALAAGIGSLAALIIAGIFIIIFGILQLICLWQFANVYDSKLVKIAVILYILTIIAALAAIPLVATMGHGALLGFIGLGILGFIAGILAGIGILTAKEQAPAPTPVTTEAPPPPPP